MFRKLFLISVSILSLINSYGANRIELVIDEDLTLESIFAAGLRPSSTTPSNMSDIRVWERQAITLLFDDFRYEIDTEQITFGVYDDDQISFMRLRTTSEKPLSVEEAVNEVELFPLVLDLMRPSRLPNGERNVQKEIAWLWLDLEDSSGRKMFEY